MLSSTLGRLRITGLLEGLSFLILLCIAMPLKYFADLPAMVRIVGMAHGILFILYVFLAMLSKFQYDWSFKKMILLWIASLLPLGTFYADYKLLRKESEAQAGT